VDLKSALEQEPEMKKFARLITDSKGATAIEYGLIAALIAVAAITAVRGVGTQVGSTFTNVSGGMSG
jgi:pilus assembly protein Flp/PilA